MDACRSAIARKGVASRDVPDVAQDTLILAWRALERGDLEIRDRTTLRAWLFRVGACRAGDFRHRWENEQPGDCVADHEVPPSAEDFLLEAEAHHALHDALAELARTAPELHRVLVAHDLDERPMPVVAAAAEINVNTAHDRLRRARERLRMIARRHPALRARACSRRAA